MHSTTPPTPPPDLTDRNGPTMTTTATPPAATRTSRSRSTTGTGTGTGRPATTGTAKSRPSTSGAATTSSTATTATGTTGQPAAPANAAANVSEQRVHAALADGADLTVAALAEATGLGRSTVSKALARLEAAGRAVRTTSGSAGRARQPDRWNPGSAATVAAPSPARPQTQTQPDPGPQPGSDPQPEAVHGLESAQQLAAGSADQAAGDDQPAAGQRPAARRSRGKRPSTADTPPAPDTATAAPGVGGDERRNPKTGTARLAPGALTQLVADHFGRNPGVPLTSGEVGRALGRSGGAVRNAADKLAADGVLRLLDGTPRRYTTTD